MTKSQLERDLLLARQEAESLRHINAGMQRHIDVLKSEVAESRRLLADSTPAEKDAALMLRVATLVTGDKDEARVYSWDDVCYDLAARQRRDEDLDTTKRNLCSKHDIDTGLTVGEVLDACDERLDELAEAQEKLDDLPDGWEEWAEFIAHTDMTPDDVERLTEVIRALGVSDLGLRYALGAVDVQLALRTVH